VVCFFSILDRLYFGGNRNSLVFNLFLEKISASNAPRGGVQVLFGHQKQQSSALKSSLP
jgi:hypothetical protein